MPLGDIYRVAVEARNLNADNVNTFHYKIIASRTGDGQQEAVNLSAAVQSDIVTVYQTLVGSSYSFQNISVRGVTDPTVGFDLALALNGTRVGETVAPQLAPLALIRSAKIGRSFNGRLYIFSPTEGDNNNGLLTAGYLGEAQTFTDDNKSRDHTTNW